MPDNKPSGLTLRIISAICLAIPTLAAIYFGAPYYNVLIAVLAVLMAWEWSKLTLNEFKNPGFTLSLFAGLIPFVGYFHAEQNDVLVAIPTLTIILYLLSMKKEGSALWFSVGALYISLPVFAFIWLRDVTEHGLELVYWVAVLVWATDTGGYFFGKYIGGPKLAPKISPKKTWAGLLGGMFGAFIVGYTCAEIGEWSEPLYISLLSAGLAVIAQIGDLFESHAKRRFGVKDSSHIIPGHGGVLDRLDGMMFAATVLAVLIFATDGLILSWL